MLEMLKKLWNVAWDMWVHCNRILHNSPQACDEILESKVNQQTSNICKQTTTSTMQVNAFTPTTIKAHVEITYCGQTDIGKTCESSQDKEEDPQVWAVSG